MKYISLTLLLLVCLLTGLYTHERETGETQELKIDSLEIANSKQGIIIDSLQQDTAKFISDHSEIK